LSRVEALRRFLVRRWKPIAAGAAALALLAASGGVLVAWSGLYSVAASKGHWLVIDRFLRFGMMNSVETHAPDVEPPPLDDADLIRLGAAHYYAGCAYCHGAPGLAMTPVAQHMLPAPPDLTSHVSLWTDQELFWLVKHGLKYTGMPGWPVQDRDDEVWAVVAFLRQMPDMTQQTYRDLALAEVEAEPQGGEEIARGNAPDAVSACARCHGDEAGPPKSELVPVLHGQPREMLENALRAYLSGERSSGIMQTAASGLSSDEVAELAVYYAGLEPPRRTIDTAGLSGHGRELAESGDPVRRIPACMSCHSESALPVYPRLAGQNARYIASRLKAWQAGQTDRTDTAAIMVPIARLLTDDDIAAVSDYFSSLPPAGGAGR
jgi:cytochrome c553